MLAGWLWTLGLWMAEVSVPAVVDDRLELKLVAAEPELVTPVGVAVDPRGGILVIESHTHFRPERYDGPPADRILRFSELDPDTGRAGRREVVFEGTTHTMNLLLAPDQTLFVATRREVLALRDSNGDGRYDEQSLVCQLETAGNYPHNGLSGLALDAEGHLYIGMGENLGVAYRLVGSDGRALAGGGEGGNVFVCDRQGKNLRRLATGFWNPFGLCFDAQGHLFAVDNDPDSRPPCRLLHLVEGGDYGFRFRNGRKGIHPFTAWNGELPGTLPMVCGTGEAPCAVLCYQADHLPSDYRGTLLVTSWGDHRLECYRLRPHGASFAAEMRPMVVGGDHFRPVGLAVMPDGSLVMSDWVDKSYPLHGMGRLWWLKAKSPRGDAAAAPSPAAAPKTAAVAPLPKAKLSADWPQDEGLAALERDDPFVQQAALVHYQAELARTDPEAFRRIDSPRRRLAVARAWRAVPGVAGTLHPAVLLADPDPAVRLYGVLWVGEERLVELRPQVEAVLHQPPRTRQLFEAVLACLDRLERGVSSDPKAESPGEALALALLIDPQTPAALGALALRSVRPDHPGLPRARLEAWLKDAPQPLKLEAIRTLRERPDGGPLLRQVAADPQAPVRLRCEAIVGLSPGHQQERRLLLTLAAEGPPEVADEALRAWRGFDLTVEEQQQLQTLAAQREGHRRELVERVLLRNPPRGLPPHENLEAWLARADGPGDPQVGERIFFHPRVGGCFRCHEWEGRGYAVGPALSTLAGQQDLRRLVASLVDPSREIAPQFTAYTLLTRDGEVLTGLHVGDEVDGRMRLADQNGRVFYVHPSQVERQIVSRQSIMPEGLVDQLTVQELRDLVAFLMRGAAAP
jgi:putative membrane-bound dehydrogenase-like protein